MVLLLTKSPNDDDDEHDNETQHQLNSTAIDSTYCKTTTTSTTTNCQSENDVETFGLLRNYNGQTISINFKQTKMHHNATTTTTTTLKRQQCHNSGHLEKSNRTTPSGYLQQFYTGRLFINTAPATATSTRTSRHLNKMHLIAIILSYLLAFSIQSASARPNVDRNDDSTSNWQSVALTSENEVS